jgi:hypothetical protein
MTDKDSDSATQRELSELIEGASMEIAGVFTLRSVF